ncbi:spore coat protein U domain-containing protein [Aureimonas fodinaquatilis]|uniref:Spore coat protein U domain-containing protein n=1 Tax=Aureimonas fodinaquatilis TaxID=2565783 RepID=A0A5B0DW63_9HYPH|nr:spore coat protein U domain-containing protein [Aureimonas fodinaquatilis]KAA0970608.1 spore coat protein U domain-containing protein [Aureimonas fodinaquatilis]
MRFWLSLGALLLIATPAAAQCTMSVSNIDFGSIDPLRTTTAVAVGQVGVNCGLLGVFCPSISYGSGGVGSSPRRRLLGPGGAFLEFDVFRDAGYSVPFGARDTPALGQPQLVANLINYSAPVYARLYRGATIPPPGLYVASFTGNNAYVDYGLTALLGCGTLTARSTTSFNVSARVESQCSVTAAPLNFGTTGVIRTAIDAATNLSVQCTPGTTYRITLDGGRTAATNPAQRRMQAPNGRQVVYGLYRNAARTQPWGETAADLLTGSGDGTIQSVPIFGRVPPQVTPPPSVYTDTVLVTITY